MADLNQDLGKVTQVAAQAAQPKAAAPRPGRRMTVDMVNGIFCPIGEGVRYLFGELEDGVLVCESPRGKFGLHLASGRVVYLEGEGMAEPPSEAFRDAKRQQKLAERRLERGRPAKGKP